MYVGFAKLQKMEGLFHLMFLHKSSNLMKENLGK
jgi:hypothetical protein